MSNYTPGTLTGDLAPVNAELEKISVAIASQLDRNPDMGQANQMEDTLDVNSNEVMNGTQPNTANEMARLVDVQVATTTGLPDQTGNAGKFLQTDGTVVSWQDEAGPPDSDDVNNNSTVTGTTVTDALNTLQSLIDTMETQYKPTSFSGQLQVGAGASGDIITIPAPPVGQVARLTHLIAAGATAVTGITITADGTDVVSSLDLAGNVGTTSNGQFYVSQVGSTVANLTDVSGMPFVEADTTLVVTLDTGVLGSTILYAYEYGTKG